MYFFFQCIIYKYIRSVQADEKTSNHKQLLVRSQSNSWDCGNVFKSNWLSRWTETESLTRVAGCWTRTKLWASFPQLYNIRYTAAVCSNIPCVYSTYGHTTSPHPPRIENWKSLVCNFLAYPPRVRIHTTGAAIFMALVI